MIYTFRDNYIGKDKIERQVVAVKNTQLKYAIYFIEPNGARKFFCLTNNKPYYKTNNNIAYISSENSPIYWGVYDENGDWSSGAMLNAPYVEFMEIFNNRLIGGGKCSYTNNGLAVGGDGNYYRYLSFTQNSKRVTFYAAASGWGNYTTGTVSLNINGTEVTGSGTTWANTTGVPNAYSGYLIGFGATPSKYYTIKDVVSNTKLIIEEPFAEASVSGASYVIVKSPVFTATASPGDLIGTGLYPSKWYIITRIIDDNTLEISGQTNNASFAEPSVNSTYTILRKSENGVHVSAEGATTDWVSPGFFGGEKNTFFFTDKPNTGLHNFNDALIIFTKEKGFFVTGNSSSEWRSPRSMRLPEGCINHDSIVSKNGYLAYMSEKGVYVSRGGSLDLSALEAVPFSSIIQKTYDDVDKDLLKYVSSFTYKDLLLISVPSVSNYSWTDPLLTYSAGTVDSDPSHEYSTGTISIDQNSNIVTGTGTLWSIDAGGVMVVNDCNDKTYPNATLGGTGTALADDANNWMEQGPDTTKGSVTISCSGAGTTYWEFDLGRVIDVDGKPFRFGFKRNSGTMSQVYCGLSTAGFATDNLIYNKNSDILSVSPLDNTGWHIIEIVPGTTSTTSTTGSTTKSQIRYVRVGFISSDAASANVDYIHYISPENIQPGYLLGVGASPTVWYEIESVDSPTSLTLTTAYEETTVSGSAYVIKRQDEIYGTGTDWNTQIESGDIIRIGTDNDYTIAEVDVGANDIEDVTLSGKGLYQVTSTFEHGLGTGDWVTVSNTSDAAVLPDGDYQIYTYDDKRLFIPYAAGTATTTATCDISIREKLLINGNIEDSLSAESYIIQKRRNNRILILDTNTNVDKKNSFGWTIANNIYATSFSLYKNQLYYGSAIDKYVYKWDTGGLLYGEAFDAYFKTARTDCGTKAEKHFKSLKIKGRGVGTVYITPIINGASKTRISYVFNDNTQCQEIFFPRTGMPFNYIGEEIQILVELEGANEDIIIYPPEVGWVPRRIKEGG